MTTLGSNLLRVALIQLKVGLNKTTNLERATTFVEQAASKGAQLVCLPECFNSPYGTQYFSEYAEPIPDGDSCKCLSQAAKSNNVWLVGGSIPERRSDGKIYNTCTVYSPSGEMVGQYSKLHLFDIDVPGKISFKESDVLSSGKSLLSIDINSSFKVGIGICYDVRFPELANAYAHSKACNLLLYPGAFNMTTGPAHWEALCRGRALDNQVYVGMCAPARDNSASYVAWSHSMIVGPWGDIVAQIEDQEEIVYADLTIDELNRVRSAIPIRNQRRVDIFDQLNGVNK